MKFSLAQLRAFVAVVDHGGFGRAAIELHTSQPAVSHAITTLERLVGGQVVQRYPRAVPTVLGHELLPYARSVLSALEAMALTARQHQRRLGGAIRLAAPATACHGLLPRWLPKWSEQLPGVTVRVFEADEDEMPRWLHDEVVDAAILIDPDPMPSGGVVVVRDTYEAVVRKDHPYATQQHIDIKDLVDDPVIVSASGCYPQVMGICRIGRADFVPAHRVRELGVLLEMVADDLGVTILPSLVRALLTPELTTVALHPVVERTLVFVGPDNRPWHPVVTALRDLLAVESVEANLRLPPRVSGVS
jgi:DNA-binding transcriptional LysR family regulator